MISSSFLEVHLRIKSYQINMKHGKLIIIAIGSIQRIMKNILNDYNMSKFLRG